ncbi:MAG: preprotein translocase subunit SecG [Magnetococcales bacterium]|nr:preprotein translocase subunit SecG [Magnetococcales bacterium]
MTLILAVVHVLVSVLLISVVLLQKGSGADMGAAFGGTSQSLFGARGSGSFLGKVTAGLATAFMLTSLSLAFYSNAKAPTTSVMEAPAAAAPADGTAKPAAEATPVPAKGEAQPAPEAPPATGNKPIPVQ